MVEFGSKGESVYVALIGDVIGSRRIEDRAHLQRLLTGEIERLNRELGPALAAPLVLISGDEIQGLLASAGAAVDVIVGLEDALFPVGLAYGLGRGPLSTDFTTQTTRLDGPCFHRARQGLENASRQRRWVRTVGLEGQADDVVASMFDLMRSVRQRWTKRQVEFVRAARGHTQKAVAESFGVSPSVVSESLKAANFRVVAEAEAVLRSYLKGFTHFGESTLNSPKKAN